MRKRITLTETQVKLLAEVERDLLVAKERKDLVLAAYLAAENVEFCDIIEMQDDALVIEDGKPELTVA